MARTTRSATTQEKEKTIDHAQPARKGAPRKRKRSSLSEPADQPATKQSRVDGDVKEEATPDPDEPQPAEPAHPEPPSSGDVPIQPDDAEKILEILEMVDTQGLLDRVFPLPTEDGLGPNAAAGPSAGTQSYSFRALLKAPSMYPIRVLRSAVQHLFPISSHPRSRPSAPAAEQLKFCNLALSLLDQASFHYAPIPHDVESLISGPPDQAAATNGEEAKPHPSRTRSLVRQRKYALVQRLPNGDWWSSLNSSYSKLTADGKDLKDMPTAYAELVAIIPAPSTSHKEPPTLASYARKLIPKPQNDVTEPRKLSCGEFLDYGLYSTFAPVFNQEGVEVGRSRLGEVLYYREREKRRRKRARELEESQVTHQNAVPTMADVSSEDGDVVEVEKPSSKQKEKMKDMDVDMDGLEGLLSAEQIASLKSTLGSLELENAVQELLARNARALERLEELQNQRLLEKGGARSVEVGSEEWEVAQGIYDSLTLLASLRPRSSQDADAAPLVPSASALRKLHRTLPMGKTEGWYGTLPSKCPTALRDDTTIHIKSGATVSAPTAPPTPAIPPVTPTVPKTPLPSYSGYPYSSYATAQYRSNYGSYAPTQTTSYFTGYHQATAAGVSPAAQYPAQYGSTGQQPYQYSGWYNYQPPAPTPGSAAPSGRATPQTPAGVTAYPGYYPTAGAQQPQPQRAVANTVLSAAGGKAYAPGWANGAASPYVAPTLPPHLRTPAHGASTPGASTPTPAAAGYQGYYANYSAAAR
ncbi:hypothetical protein EIP86_009851 [Pleurotus ostreatoroseus]|nr:hypothetical protein EIP86_009851 [Pleurotus ostreatoroseus]